MPLSSVLMELLERGLQSVSDEASIRKRSAELTACRAALADAEVRVRGLETLAVRLQQSVGTCPKCGEPVAGGDLLVSGACPNCGAGLSSLIQAKPRRPDAKGGLEDAELMVMIGAIGIALGFAILQSK